MKTLILVLTLFLGNLTYSQQQAQFTQYNDNMLYFNAGYTGAREMLSVTGIHRQQWVGIEGAPMSSSIGIHSPLTRYRSVGLGLNVFNDIAGPVNQTWINGSFSYSFQLTEHSKLSLGLSAGINLASGNFSELNIIDPNDPIANVNFGNDLSPLFGAGIYYESKKFYAGASIPRVLEQSDLSASLSGRLPEQRHYYLMAGGYIDLNRRFKLRPSTMFKFTENAPFALDVSLALIVYDRFWIGANYRLLESAGAFVQYQLTDNFKLGYSVDFSTSKLVNYNYGTHEIALIFDMNLDKSKIVTPRFF